MLGFASHFIREKTEIAQYPTDLRGGIDALYVYCDLVDNAIVGNIHAPLLRIIPVKGQYSEIVDQIYNALHYMIILIKKFSSVHITIKDDQNRLIPFAFGKTMVKLHFRKHKILIQ